MEKNISVNELVQEMKTLTPKEKLVLLQKLQHPADPQKQAEMESRFRASFGGWKGDETAEELVESIYNSRTAIPERELLDQ